MLLDNLSYGKRFKDGEVELLDIFRKLAGQRNALSRRDSVSNILVPSVQQRIFQRAAVGEILRERGSCASRGDEVVRPRRIVMTVERMPQNLSDFRPRNAGGDCNIIVFALIIVPDTG